MELFRQLDNGQTDRQTDGLTELFLKSLSRLKSLVVVGGGHTWAKVDFQAPNKNKQKSKT